MLAVAFDTLKLARKLENAGFPPKQAQDAAAALSESISEWHGSGNLATKDDVHTLHADIQGIKVDIAQTKAEIAASKAEILKWIFGQTLAIIGSVIGIVAFAAHGAGR